MVNVPSRERNALMRARPEESVAMAVCLRHPKLLPRRCRACLVLQGRVPLAHRSIALWQARVQPNRPADVWSHFWRANMSKSSTDFGAAWWSGSLSEVDRELVRLASICNVRLLDPGVLERVLANDATVCGTANQIAFDKLRNMLMMHYTIRSRAVDSIGEAGATAVVQSVVQDLRKKFGDVLGAPPPAV
jgi:hypothetical protein